MTVRFVIVAEDKLGAKLTRDLCDRVVADRGVPWLKDLWADDQVRPSQREWIGLEQTRPWSSWVEIKRHADRLGIRAHGLGLKAHGAKAHKAVAVATKLDLRASAIFLAHDTDGDRDVATRMREGALPTAGKSHGFEVILAVAHPEVEAWVIAGFKPSTESEHEQHEAERQRLGFNPVVKPHKLSSNRATDKRDAKRTASTLLGGDNHEEARWEQCWRETSLDVLEENGQDAGLKDYIQEVERCILPLLGDTEPR